MTLTKSMTDAQRRESCTGIFKQFQVLVPPANE